MLLTVAMAKMADGEEGRNGLGTGEVPCSMDPGWRERVAVMKGTERGSTGS